MFEDLRKEFKELHIPQPANSIAMRKLELTQGRLSFD